MTQNSEVYSTLNELTVVDIYGWSGFNLLGTYEATVLCKRTLWGMESYLIKFADIVDMNGKAASYSYGVAYKTTGDESPATYKCCQHTRVTPDNSDSIAAIIGFPEEYMQ